METGSQPNRQSSKRRWHRLTPDRLLIALLPVEHQSVPMTERLFRKPVGRETCQKTTVFGTQTEAAKIRPLLGGKAVP
jgi:hypothetical protein